MLQGSCKDVAMHEHASRNYPFGHRILLETSFAFCCIVSINAGRVSVCFLVSLADTLCRIDRLIRRITLHHLR